MKSGDNNNTLERFFEESDEPIESPEPEPEPEPVESTPESSDEPTELLPEPDEPTDDGLYETILSWERNTEKHTDYSPDPHWSAGFRGRSVGEVVGTWDRGSITELAPCMDTMNVGRFESLQECKEKASRDFQHWTDTDFFDKKFGFQKTEPMYKVKPHKRNREKFDISPRDVFIKAYLDEYKDVSRVKRILSAIDTALSFFLGIMKKETRFMSDGEYIPREKDTERIIEKRIDQPYIQNRFGFSLQGQEIIRQAVLKTDPNWKEGDEGFVLGEDDIPYLIRTPITRTFWYKSKSEREIGMEGEIRQLVIGWSDGTISEELLTDDFKIPPEMSDPTSKVIDPMLDIYHYSIEKGKFNDANNVLDWIRDQINQHYDFDPQNNYYSDMNDRKHEKSGFHKKTEDFIEGVKKLANNYIDELVDHSKSFNWDFEDKRKM